MSAAKNLHEPVLLEESLELLRIEPGAVVIDATLDPGGHAEALLGRVGPEGRVIGIDRDPEAVALATTRLAAFGPRFTARLGDHREIAALMQDSGVVIVDGVLADLGISSAQLDDAARGFSFSSDGPLDMRLDPTSGDPTAADLVGSLDERDLRELIATWGEDRLAGRIARAIVRSRADRPIETTRELAS